MGRAQSATARGSFSAVFGERRGLRSEQEGTAPSALPDPAFAYASEVAERRMRLVGVLLAYLSAVGALGYSVEHFLDQLNIWDDCCDASDIPRVQREVKRQVCQGDIDALMEQGILHVSDKSAPGPDQVGRVSYAANSQEDWPAGHRVRFNTWHDAVAKESLGW